MTTTSQFYKELIRYGRIITDYNFSKDDNSIRINKILYDNNYYIVIMENGIVKSISQEIFTEGGLNNGKTKLDN